MAGGLDDASSTRIEPFFEALLSRDASGRSWLPALLQAAPNGRARLGPALQAPGPMLTPLAVRGANGRLGCFEYPATPPRRLLLWYVEHPDRLDWPAGTDMTAEAVRLRRALLEDDPPGSRARAQERARELEPKRSPFMREWWRFEEVTTLDCVLINEQFVVTITGKRNEPLSPATMWYPQRSELVRSLEAARETAKGRQWASLLISDDALRDGAQDALERSIRGGAPHLDPSEREELCAAYLGNLTWDAARAAVGLP
jgi:hypothetical protein